MKTVNQEVEFPTTPKKLYDTYMDSKKHAKALGNQKVSIGKRVGSTFSIWGGMLKGKTLFLQPGKMIVQTWRAKGWKDPLDSILILTFHKTKKGAKISLTHTNLSVKAAKDVNKGWNDHYWKPWKKYFRST